MRIFAFMMMFCAFFLSACDQGKSEDSPNIGKNSSEPIKVRYAGSSWYGHAPVWVGIEQGYFKDAGFDLEIVSRGTSAQGIDLLSSDSAEFSSLGQVAMLTAMSKDNRNFVWLGNQNIAPGNEGIVAREGINTIEDLKGKKIAVPTNTSAHLTLGDILKQHGMKIGDVEVVSSPASDVVSSLKGGTVDAGVTWEPHYASLKEIEGTKLLGTDLDTTFYKTHKTMSGPDVICMAEKWFNADKDRATRLMEAYFKAVEWCADHPEELIKLIASRPGANDEAVIRASMQNFEWLGWDRQLDALNKLRGQSADASKLMAEMKIIESAPKVEDWMRYKLYQK